MFCFLTDVGVMHFGRITSLLLIILMLSSFIMTDISTAEDTIENLVVAEFHIAFVTSTSLNLEIIMDAQKLTTDATYNADGIKSASELNLGAFSLLLYQMLDRQLSEIFKNADIVNFTMPIFDGDKFIEKLNVELTSSYFGMNTSVNANNFINGVLDMDAVIAYNFNFQAEPGWNNTYTITLLSSMNRPYTNGKIVGNGVQWKVENENGDKSNISADK